MNTVMYDVDEPEKVDVTVKQMLFKDTIVLAYDKHVCSEREWDAAEGRYVYINSVEVNDKLDERFREQQRTALQVIGCCGELVEELMKDGHRWYANIDLAQLSGDCAGWQEESLNIKEV